MRNTRAKHFKTPFGVHVIVFSEANHKLSNLLPRLCADNYVSDKQNLRAQKL